ncbi:MAG: histidinol-phosphatase HisJ family protein [Firmicutes bacterium]|nr:histidinol-phosphatase HisJ family protein [Bacillota bacterium]
MIETHSHTQFSQDGKMTLLDLAMHAINRGYIYLAVTEHLDKDYLFSKNEKEKSIIQLNLDAYEKEFNRVKGLAGDKMYLAFGVEAGYCAEATPIYNEIFSKYKFDIIINSVHSVNYIDAYFSAMNSETKKDEFYIAYLKTVLDSVKAPYEWDILGHLGYPSRYVSYKDSRIYYSATKPLIDEILTEMIKRGKTLEINAKSDGGGMLPEKEVLARYKELGGTELSFGSDAHHLSRLGEGFGKASELAKSLGFTHWNIFKGRKKEKVAI